MALGHAVVNGQTGTNPDFAGALGSTQLRGMGCFSVDGRGC
jgi:hypothetical protein